MGGRSSKDDGLSFDFREECQKWRLEDVRSAYARWRAKKDAARDPTLELNRRDYWEVFTDYAVMVDGGFLSLPMDKWDVFDVHKTNKIFALEVFVLLALFGRGDQTDKLEFCFRIFDFDNDAHLRMPDMVVLLQSVTAGARKVGITPRQPTTKELEALAQQAFEAADHNMDDKVSLTEFKEWASSNIESQDLFARFGAKEEEETVQKKAAGRQASRRNVTGRAAGGAGGRSGGRGAARGRGASMGSSRRIGGAKRSGTGLGGLSKHERRSASNRDISSTGRQDKATKQLTALHIQEERTRKMKLRTIASGKVMHSLLDATAFNQSDLNKLASRFVDVSNVTGKLTRDDFCVILKEAAPRFDDQEITRLYQIVDKDNSGDVDFKEFVLGLSRVVSGTLDDKIELVFRMNDVDGDGTMEIAELAHILHNSTTVLKDSVSFASEIITSFDVNGDCEISIEEFNEAVSTDSSLKATFQDCMSITRPQALSIHILIDSQDGMEEDNLALLMESITSATGPHSEPLSCAQCVAFFRKHFHTDTAGDGYVESVFREFDSAKTDSVPLNDILCGIIQIMVPSLSDQIQYYFKLYDADGTGSLDKNEIMALLVSNLRRKDENAQRVMKLLADLDRDGDARITCAEFTALARKDPLIMDAMGTMFGGATTHIGKKMGGKGRGGR